jgi:2-iminobutanoate/2-iminopropanoate deaminase
MPQRIFAPSAPNPIGPYNQAIRSGEFVFCSGQVGLDPATSALVGGGITAQTHQVLRNLEAVLAASGLSLDDVVKTTIYLVDLADFSAVNTAYGEHFGELPPARSTIGVVALPLGARVEIDAIAIGPSSKP